ncbi:MAG: carboxy terminal-processing peptidase [Gammaproteobacteria bacterium]
MQTPGSKLLLIVFCLALQVPAEATRTVPIEQLKPSIRHATATKIILHVISTQHYRNKQLNDELSMQIMDNYLDSLDGNRNYLIKRDIEQIREHRYQLDDALMQNRVTLAYDIFRFYRQRVTARADYAIKLLEQPFDFTIDEQYQFDRRETDWPADMQALNEIWRKRVKNDYLNLKLAGKEPAEITKTLKQRYTRLRNNTVQLDANDVYQIFINAYTTAIEPHTSYFSPRSSENFDISMSLSLEGIGAVLRLDNDYTTVQKVMPGGPADLNGELKPNDKIVGVGQNTDGVIEDVIGWRLDDVVGLIRGKKGSIVRLEVRSEDEGPTRVIQITRDKIKLEEQAAKSEIIELDNGYKAGVIDIPTFYSDFAAQARGEKDFKSTSRDTRKLITELKKQDIDGLLIDLRGNGGGSLAEALEFTGLFIEKGPVVQTRNAAGKIEVNRDPDSGIAYGGPLAVLVDRNSASASEIFTGAIQDYRRGIIIGEPTFGKGTVQNIVDLNRFVRSPTEDHGKLKTTIAQFFRISGGSNQFKGVVPDIVLPTAQYGDPRGERTLDNALPWETIKPARYLAASAPVERYDQVRKRHEERIRDNELLQLLLADMKQNYQRSERKSVSLLETQRRQEREQLLRDKHQLDNEFRVARGLPPLPYKDEADDDEADDAEADNEETEDEPQDLILQETAHILIDLVAPQRQTAGSGSARPSTSPPPSSISGN